MVLVGLFWSEHLWLALVGQSSCLKIASGKHVKEKYTPLILILSVAWTSFRNANVVGGTGWAVLVGAFMVGVGGSVIMSEVIAENIIRKMSMKSIPQ